MRVLIAEDDEHIAADLARALTGDGYVVETARDGERAWFLGDTEDYTAIILDLGLPKLDGLTILKRLREAGRTTPVLILTARGSWPERVEGIDAGADDYLPKPFRVEELLARLRAIVRRAAGQASSVVDMGDISLDERQMKVTRRGIAIALTPLEYRLFAYLARNRGRVVSQSELIEHVYAQDYEREFERHRGAGCPHTQEAWRRSDRDTARIRLHGRGPGALMRRSLRLRLALAGAIAIAVVLAVAAVGLAYLFERHTSRVLAEDLDATVRQIAGALTADPAGGLALIREPADPRYASPLSGLYWEVAADGQRSLRSRSLWDAALKLPDNEPADGTIHHANITGPRGEKLLLAELKVSISAGTTTIPVRIDVASSLTRVIAARNDFLRDLAPAMAVLALILIVSSYVQISLGLRPLDRIRVGIAAVRRQDASRFDEPIPSEVRPLVEELNGLLTVHERDLARAREGAADLAHGLKTPLAALRGDAANLRARGDNATADQIDGLVDAMLRSVERELVRTRIRGRATLRNAPTAALAPNVRRLVDTLKRTPSGSRVNFETDIADGATVLFDADDLVEVLGNLLDNAARHAAGRVVVRALPSGATSVTSVVVEDDGPGIPAELRASVLERGRRLDEGPGSGLGLAIVRDVLDEYGWALTLGQSPLGGLAATLAKVG